MQQNQSIECNYEVQTLKVTLKYCSKSNTLDGLIFIEIALTNSVYKAFGSQTSKYMTPEGNLLHKSVTRPILLEPMGPTIRPKVHLISFVRGRRGPQGLVITLVVETFLYPQVPVAWSPYGFADI